jgi:hypothetical protein
VRFSTRGVQKHQNKLSGKNTCQKPFAEKVEKTKVFFLSSFPSVFVRFSTRGVQKHHKNFLGKIHVKNFWPKKLRKQPFFLSSFPVDFVYRVFGRFSA